MGNSCRRIAESTFGRDLAVGDRSTLRRVRPGGPFAVSAESSDALLLVIRAWPYGERQMTVAPIADREITRIGVRQGYLDHLASNESAVQDVQLRIIPLVRSSVRSRWAGALVQNRKHSASGA